MKVQVKSLIAQGIFIGASSGLFYMTYRLGMGFTAPMLSLIHISEPTRP